MVKLQRGGQIEAGSGSYHELAVEMRLCEGGRKVDAGAGRTRSGDGGDDIYGFVIRWRANGQPAAHNQTVPVADGYVGRAGAGGQRRARVRLDCVPHFRDRDGLDPMTDAVGICPA